VFHGPTLLGFPRMLYDTLLHLRYNRDVPVYHARMSMAHSMEQYEVIVTIPLNPAEPWMATVIGVELDNTVDQTTHFAIRETLCGSRTLRPYLTPRACTSTQAWLQWLSMHNPCSTCSTTSPRLSYSCACVWPLMMSATSPSHASSHS
jgi:hypothetical protein